MTCKWAVHTSDIAVEYHLDIGGNLGVLTIKKEIDFESTVWEIYHNEVCISDTAVEAWCDLKAAIKYCNKLAIALQCSPPNSAKRVHDD